MPMLRMPSSASMPAEQAQNNNRKLNLVSCCVRKKGFRTPLKAVLGISRLSDSLTALLETQLLAVAVTCVQVLCQPCSTAMPHHRLDHVYTVFAGSVQLSVDQSSMRFVCQSQLSSGMPG